MTKDNKFKINDLVIAEDSYCRKFKGSVTAIPDDECDYYLVDCEGHGNGAFYESELNLRV